MNRIVGVGEYREMNKIFIDAISFMSWTSIQSESVSRLNHAGLLHLLIGYSCRSAGLASAILWTFRLLGRVSEDTHIQRSIY